MSHRVDHAESSARLSRASKSSRSREPLSVPASWKMLASALPIILCAQVSALSEEISRKCVTESTASTAYAKIKRVKGLALA